MVQIDKRIKDALREAADKIGTQEELAKKAGVSKSNIGKYLTGGITVIRNETYAKLLPFLDLPEEDNGNAVSLSSEELEKLASKGIECRYETDFLISPKGLCWLYNGLLFNNKTGSVLSAGLLRELLRNEPPQAQCRELHICAFSIEAYNSREYCQYAFYLNGTPPKFYTAGFDKTYRLTEHFEFYNGLNAPFEIDDRSYVEVCFSREELAALKAGKTLKAKIVS